MLKYKICCVHSVNKSKLYIQYLLFIKESMNINKKINNKYIIHNNIVISRAYYVKKVSHF